MTSVPEHLTTLVLARPRNDGGVGAAGRGTVWGSRCTGHPIQWHMTVLMEMMY